VLEKKALVATYNDDCLKLADCVVVDVQCDYTKYDLGNMRTGRAEMGALEATIKTIGEKVSAKCLTLIETTVAPGTTEFVAWPIMKKAFAARSIKSEPLLAHSFERVMPGRNYVSSIRDFWRVCSGCNAEARKRVEKFLREVLNTEKFPLTIMDRPIESETTKIVENSYRATILAFLDEWSLFSERNGVDLIRVIRAIKVRPTHSNIIFPGPGVGGYCLPKDGGLGYWAYKHILGFSDDIFKMTTMAIDINDTRALHVATLARDALQSMGRQIAGAPLLLCGASYRQDVADTRYSGSETVVRKLTEMGAEMRVHDPYLEHWYELEKQDTYPAAGHSLSRFFRNQDELVNIRVQHDLASALGGVQAIILAVGHEPYLQLDPDKIVEWAGAPLAVIDCFGILDDEKIRRYFELGCEVKALGRGHLSRLKEQPPTLKKPRVFICYAREDKNSALNLYNSLRSWDCEPWMDTESLLPGQEWHSAVRKAIRASRYFIPLLSSRSVGKKGYVQKEIKEALNMLDEFPEQEIFVIPARLDECEPSHDRLKDLHWVDMFPDWYQGFTKIIAAMKQRQRENPAVF
jgi:nucleotide sugar dehydrogenase